MILLSEIKVKSVFAAPRFSVYGSEGAHCGRAGSSAMKIRSVLWAALACAGVPTVVVAAGPGGHFRYGDVRMEVRHAYAVPDQDEGAEGNVLVFLTSVPIEAQAVADAFDPGHAVEEQINGK